jgi:2-polyprenyl-3-methyl-5-hydroxy-6-metoxy-1,4-benzoquinol methylase
MFHDLIQRRRSDEWMDDPALDGRRHRQALRGLARLNVASGSVGRVWQLIRKLMRDRGTKELSLLDVATGSGDIPIGLYRRARRAGLHLTILAVDLSETALDVARRRAAQRGAEIEFRQLDILADPLTEQFDVVLCSLFLHHLDEGPALALLRILKRRARHRVVVNDLLRSRLSWVLVWLGSRLLSRSDVVHFDALASVRAAFTPSELRGLLHSADLESAWVRSYWPCRLLSVWSRP